MKTLHCIKSSFSREEKEFISSCEVSSEAMKASSVRFYGLHCHPQHPDSRDWDIEIYEIDGIFVAATNGNPVWEAARPDDFASLLEEYGLTLADSPMTEAAAIAWVREQDEDSELDQDELEAVFMALHGRKPDDDDRQAGLWSLCCAAIPGCGTRPEEKEVEPEMDASDILAQLNMTIGTATEADVELAYRLADESGTIQAGDMIKLVGYSDPTKHTCTGLTSALHMLGCEDAD